MFSKFKVRLSYKKNDDRRSLAISVDRSQSEAVTISVLGLGPFFPIFFVVQARFSAEWIAPNSHRTRLPALQDSKGELQGELNDARVIAGGNDPPKVAREEDLPGCGIEFPAGCNECI